MGAWEGKSNVDYEKDSYETLSWVWVTQYKSLYIYTTKSCQEMTSMGGRREDGFTILPPQLSVLPYYKFLGCIVYI